MRISVIMWSASTSVPVANVGAIAGADPGLVH